jgi:hypothetical protein
MAVLVCSIQGSHAVAILSNLDMQQCPKMFCNFVQKVLAKNIGWDTPLSTTQEEKIREKNQNAITC